MKKTIKSLLIIVLTILLSGCIKRDSMEDITINTTIYPISYITERLYGTYSNVLSIYPRGIITNEYELTEKQIKDYSNNELFIFNGLDNEKNYVEKFFVHNNDLLIIDSSNAMTYNYGIEELWLDPLNLLNMANNIKKGLNEYINDKYLKDEINENYKEIDSDLSSLAAKMQLTISGATNHDLVIGSKVLSYLKKYNNDLNIHNLDIESNDPSYEKIVSEVKTLIKNEKVKYIYLIQNEEKNQLIENLEKDTDIEIIYINPIDNITLDQEDNNEDYISIMLENLEQLKKELYK